MLVLYSHKRKTLTRAYPSLQNRIWNMTDKTSRFPFTSYSSDDHNGSIRRPFEKKTQKNIKKRERETERKREKVTEKTGKPLKVTQALGGSVSSEGRRFFLEVSFGSAEVTLTADVFFRGIPVVNRRMEAGNPF